MSQTLRAILLLLCGLSFLGCGKTPEPVVQVEVAPPPPPPAPPPPPPEIVEVDTLVYLPSALTSAAGAHLGAVTDPGNTVGETLLAQLQPVVNVFVRAGLAPAQVEHFWAGADRARNELIVCVRTKAKFDPEMIRKGLGAQAQLSKQDRTEIYALADHSGKQNSVAFVDDRTFLLGRNGTVQAATKKPAGGILRQGLTGLDQNHRHFWIAGDTSALLNRLNEGVLSALVSLSDQSQKPQAFAFGMFTGVQVASAAPAAGQTAPASSPSSPPTTAAGPPGGFAGAPAGAGPPGGHASGPAAAMAPPAGFAGAPAGAGPAAGHASGPPASMAPGGGAPGMAASPNSSGAASGAAGGTPQTPEVTLSLSFESESVAQSIERVIAALSTPAAGSNVPGQTAGAPGGMPPPGAPPGGGVPGGRPPGANGPPGAPGAPPMGAPPGAGAPGGRPPGAQGAPGAAPPRRPMLRDSASRDAATNDDALMIVLPWSRRAATSGDPVESTNDIRPQQRSRGRSSSLMSQATQAAGGQGGQTIAVRLSRQRNVLLMTLQVPTEQAALLTEGFGDVMQSAGISVLGDGIFDSTLAVLQRGLKQLSTEKSDRYVGARLLPDKAMHAGSSWMVELLPYIGRQKLYNKLDPSQTWIADQNIEVAFQVIPEFLTPGDPRTRWRGHPFDGMALTHFVGMSGIEDRRNVVAATLPRSDPRAGVFGSAAIAKEQDITDGLSQTIMVIGSGRITAPWAHAGGATIRGARPPYFDRLTGFGSEGLASQGAYVLMADGSAREISGNIDPKVFQALCTIHGAEQVDLKPVLQADR